MARPTLPSPPAVPAVLRRPRVPGLGSTATRVVVVLVVVALAAGAYAFWPKHGETTLTAQFTRAVGLYPGSDVRILGVAVGKVTTVVPAGDRVDVTFQVDDTVPVPASAKAAIVAPSLVSDRYVQLLPAWTSGPRIADGATIPLDRTAVPVELDRISQSLDDLLVALGPNGANKDGSLSRLLQTSAANLGGQGQNLHDTTHDLSLALQTLSGGRDDFFATVKNLQSFTTMLAQNDQQVRDLNTNLATVSQQLEGERGDLGDALANLATALTEISTFVQDNRTVLKSDLAQLNSTTATLVKNRDALAETLEDAPVALSNLQNAYHPETGTLDTRNNTPQLMDPRLLLCGVLSHLPQGGAACTQLFDLLKTIPVLGQLPIPGIGLPSAIPSALTTGSGTAPSAAAPASPAATAVPAGDELVHVGGADPTLGGLLGGDR